MQKKQIIIKIWIDLLTFLAGFLNGGFLLQAGAAVSHHSGNITRFALDISLGAFKEAASVLIFLFFFCAGSCISGILFHDRHFRFSKRYGVLLMTFSVILLFIALFNPPVRISLAASCMILGMQNGMFIFYKDILIRTTHFSGYLTDAGLALGMVLRGKRQELKRCWFYVSGIVCFITGAAVSVFVAPQVFFYTASCFYFLTGLFYFIFRTYTAAVQPVRV